MVEMIDCAVSFLGPDLDAFREDLMDLGKRHSAYGVQPDYLPIMARAVMFALDELLGNKLTKEDRQSWQLMFAYMIGCMSTRMK